MHKINNSDSQQRMPYNKPMLISYGSVNAITGGMRLPTPSDGIEGAGGDPS